MPDAHTCAALLLDTIPALMRQMHGAFRQRQKPSEETALNVGQFRILDMLQYQPWMLRELAERHHVTPSTMSRLVDKLVEKEWVTRQDDPQDRRQVILQLTTEGRESHAAMVARMHETVAQMVAELSDEDLAKLYDGVLVLRKMLDRGNDCL